MAAVGQEAGEEEEEIAGGPGSCKVVLILCLEDNRGYQIHSCFTGSALGQLPAGGGCGKALSTPAELCSVTPGSICCWELGERGSAAQL